MQTKWVFGVLVLVVIIGGFFLFQRPVSESETIKVGVIGPYTGGLAQYGDAYRNGVILAQEDLRARGVDNIEFVFEDSAYDTAQAISAFRKLTTVDKVDLVMDWGAATSFGIAPIVEDSQTPFIAFSVDPDVTASSEYIVRHFYSPDDFAETLWRYFRSQGQSDIAIVKLQLLYYEKIAEALQRQAQAGESVTVVEEHQFGDSDFRTSIAKIRTLSSMPDTLGVFLAGGQIAQFYRQMKDQGLELSTFGADFFESLTEIEAAEGLMNGAVYANIGGSDEFVERYKKRFGNENQVSFAAQSYDFVHILADEVDFSSAESILSSLKSVRNYQGELGAYTYTEVGNDQYMKVPVLIKTIRNGEFVKLEN